MQIISTLLCIYLILRPYYIFSSGGLQVSDFFLITAFFVFLLSSVKNKKNIREELKENKLFVIFTICTFVINGLYFIFYLKFKFMLSSIYYVFNLMAIIIFSVILKNDEKFVKKFDVIIKLNLIIQLLVYVFSIGRYYDNDRYMGTFNDPNQFGYYILISFAYISIFNYKLNLKKSSLFLFLIISIFLIFVSGSTGMVIGICVMIILNTLEFIKKIIKYIPNIILTLIFLVPIVISFLLVFDININTNNLKDIVIFDRLSGKINKVINYNELDGSTYSQMSIFEERGYDKLWIYPQYLFYGAGEGEYTRFYLSAHTNEIHATFPSILFYYGIIPTCILIVWLYNKLKNLRLEYKIIYFALLLESFTLLNQRQALFWVVFVIGSLLGKKEYSNEEE